MIGFGILLSIQVDAIDDGEIISMAKTDDNPSLQSLAQSLVTQALYYLGDMGARGGDEMTNMDMAKHLIDTLDVLENKTKGNLTPEEQQFLDTALYEARMRFIAVSGQVIAGA